MNLDYFAEFAIIVREGSLSKAANRLLVSQASLSRHLRSLETDLGVCLLERGPEGVRLTEAGEIAYPYAADVLDIEETVRNRMASFIPSPILTIFGLGEYLTCMRILRESLPCWQEKPVPQLQFRPRPTGGGSVALDVVRRNPLSVLCTLSTNPDLGDVRDLDVIELFHPRVMIVMDPSNPLAGKTSISRDDLQGHLVLRTDTSAHQINVLCNDSQQLLQRMGVECRYKSVIWDNSSDFFREPLGAAVLPLTADTHALVTNLAYGRVALPLEEARRTVVAVCQKEGAVSSWLRLIASKKASDDIETPSAS